MKKRLVFLCLFFGAAFIVASNQAVQAAGFGIYEWGARGMALGGAMVGRADDPSAIAFNPAGITQLPGLQIQSGVTFITPAASVDATNPYSGAKHKTDGKTNVWTIPHLYSTYQVFDNLTLGLGVYSRFGLGTDFDQHWWGRYNTYQAHITTISANPTLAFKLTDDFSVGIGLEIMKMEISLRQKVDGKRMVYAALGGLAPGWLTARGISTNINDPNSEAMDVGQHLYGESVGFGANLGLHYKISKHWAVGATYRSRVSHNISGTADYSMTQQASGNLAPFMSASPALFRSTDVKATMTLPDSFSAGVVYKPLDNLSIEVGAVYTLWSTYEKLEVEYSEASLGRSTVTTKKNWNDTIRLNVGVEYSPLEWLALRASYVFDQEPIQNGYEDYMLPTNDRHLIGLGVGFQFRGWTADLAYTYLKIEDRTVDARTADGVMRSYYTGGDAHMVAMTLGYRF
jgi:long-chain fatty acid transport protein